MIQTVYRDDFQATFAAVRPGNFTRAGLDALYDYLSSTEDKVEYTLDVIMVCCDFTEYASAAELRKTYSADQYPDLENFTDVIKIEGTGGLIVRNF